MDNRAAPSREPIDGFMNQPSSSIASSGTAASDPDAPQGWPLLRLGFRPFYLGTALLAFVTIPVWVAAFLGQLPLALSFPPLLWHGHEMLFGFAAGVIAGFLLTAVRAWTGLPTPRGPLLGVLALLWLLARLAAVLAPYAIFAVVDMLLLPAVAVILLRVLRQAGNKRNIPLISIMLGMALVNAVFHLAVLDLVPVPAMSALHAQLALVLMVICVMTGRVVPLFTRNVTPGLPPNMPPRRFELNLLSLTAVAFALWVVEAPALLVAALSLVAAVLHFIRLWTWRPMVTLTRPILWILHAAYLWIPIGFLLLAASQMGWIMPSLAVHAFAVGTIGGLVIGMITRTARGHTGRPLKASTAEAIAYLLVMLAAVVRVLVPVIQPDWYAHSLDVAGGLWALAFGIYLFMYGPWLTRTRLDGKDG